MNGRTRPAGKSVCIFYILNNSFHIFISPQKDGSLLGNVQSCKIKTWSIGTWTWWELGAAASQKGRNISAHVFCRAAAPFSSCFGASCLVLQACSALSPLWEGRWTSAPNSTCMSRGWEQAVLSLWLLSALLASLCLQQNPGTACCKNWWSAMTRGERSSSLSAVLRDEYFGFAAYPSDLIGFLLPPLNHWWKSASLKGHVLLFVAGKQNKTK